MKLLGILALSFLISIQSLSQDTTKNMIEMGPIIVIGIRADNKTPISQKTLKGSDIQKTYQGQEIPILLDKTPSITSASDGGHPQGYTYFRIRGIDQSRINMTLNGVPLNEPEDQGVYTSNYPGFTNIIQSMQIQRGVGTSTNGVASYGGSINFQSQNGFDKKTELDFGGGSFNTKRFNMSSATGLTDKKFALFTDASWYSTDGYKHRSGGNGFSGFISGGYYGTSDVVKLTAFSGKSINEMAWLAVSEKDIAKDRRTNYNINDAKDDFRQSFYQLQYIKTLSQESKVSTTIFYNRLDGKYDYFMSGNKSITLGSNFYGLIINYRYAKNNLKINTGLNANSYEREHKNSEDHTSDLGIGTYSNEGYKNDLGLFAKIAYDLHKFTLFGDLQYRYAEFKYFGDVKMNDISWGFLNPKAGITFNQSKRTNFYFSWGKSKREPTRTNLFGGYDNLITLVDIKPESVTDYELGLNITKQHYILQGNLYYMDFKNEITLLGALGSNGLPLMKNVSKSFRSGIEADFIYKSIFEILTSSTNLDYSYNRIKDKGIKFQPLYTPSLIINQSLLFDIGIFNVGLTGKYQSKSYMSFDNKYTIPEFFILGLNGSYSYKFLNLSIQVINLTGAKYYTSGYVINNERYFFTNALTSFYTTLKIKI